MRVFILVCLAIGSASCVGCSSDRDEDYSYVHEACNSKLRDIDSLGKFKTFMRHFKSVVATGNEPKKGLLGHESKYYKCYKLKDALIELETLINSRRGNGVCDMEYINLLVEFHYKYLTKGEDLSEKMASAKNVKVKSSSYLYYFFSLYTHQVAMRCKMRLVSRVTEAQEYQDCTAVLERFITKPQDSDDISQVPNHMKLPEEFLQYFKKVEDFVPIVDQKNPSQPNPFIEVLIPDNIISNIEAMKSDCLAREPYYLAIFAPVSTLAQIGYTVSDDQSDLSDADEAEERLLKCWLATAQLCQGILRTHLKVKNDLDVDAELSSKLVSIKWESGHTPSAHTTQKSKLQIFDHDVVDEISPIIRDLVAKKLTQLNRIKSGAMARFQSFVRNRIDVEGMENQARQKFLEALTDGNQATTDTKVAFNGAKYNGKQFNAIDMVAGEADTLVRMSSPAWSSKVSLVISCIVGIVMSAVFVWFTMYAIATTVNQHLNKVNDDNIKSDWRNLRSEKIKKIEAKIGKKNNKVFTVYKPA